MKSSLDDDEPVGIHNRLEKWDLPSRPAAISVVWKLFDEFTYYFVDIFHRYHHKSSVFGVKLTSRN